MTILLKYDRLVKPPWNFNGSSTIVSPTLIALFWYPANNVPPFTEEPTVY